LTGSGRDPTGLLEIGRVARRPEQTSGTQQGLLIPRQWLEGIDEVEIWREQNMILIVPISNDPILQLGTQPIVGDVERIY
jgi:hypothetical protein